ncbi:trypsin-like serine protease [Bacillus vallismortis]|uniref:trypsin-like peptidase domain-containing protein n=1 Tax=Bacillus vallismortis TaxID=72361 RepID=UPI0034612199
MSEHLTHAVGKVHCGHNDGTLFLIGPNLAITAFHVVDSAIRYGEEIEIDFPILNCDGINASVLFPKSIENTDIPDIALLELSSSLEINPLKLASLNLDEGIEWTSFGYPVTKEEMGQVFKGTVAQAQINRKSLQYDIDLFCTVPNLSDINFSAKGASGSPIVIGEYVVGVLTDVMPGSTIGMVDLKNIQSLLGEYDINMPFLGDFGKYQPDIRKLKDYSRMVAESNSDYSRLWVNREEIKIHRECVNVIQHKAESGSLLVIGEPGSGKSGALCDLVINLIEDQCDVIFLDVGLISAEGMGSLRNELGLTVDLNQVLENWLGDNTGYVVIDALDAARSEKSAQTLRSLISRVKRTSGRWRVVASVRKFDLRHDNELRRLFQGHLDTEFQDPELAMLRHIQIPLFNEEEISEIGNLAPVINSLLEEANETMRELICSPFNLRIIGELLEEGVQESELVPIQTQRELLDRYWSYRIIRRDGQRDAREFLLTKTVKVMVASRTLKVARNLVVDASTSNALHDLLSTNVLIEWQPPNTRMPDSSIISFSHHILFDFAVHRLMLQGDHEKVVNLLVENPELVLIIRPSLVHRFADLWMLNGSHDNFWDLIFRLIEKEQIPQVAKLIGPSIAVELANTIGDFKLLFQKLDDQDVNSRVVAEEALSHLIGGFVASRSEPLKNEILEVWSEIAEQLSKEHTSSSKKVLYLLHVLLKALCEIKGYFNENYISNLGIAARRLLEKGYEDPEYEWMIDSLITCVCKTFSSDGVDSERLLKGFLTLERIREKGYKEIPVIARELPMLYKYSPSFVKEVYCIAFLHEESSDQVTSLGRSQILPLQSNRRQDYRHALWQLSEDYPDYLKEAPFQAVLALMKVIENYILRKHSNNTTEKELSFEFNEEKAIIYSDLSYIWDSGSYREDEQIKMLDSFQEYMIKLGKDYNQTKLRQGLLKLIIKHNKTAVIWRRLIIAGLCCPESLGLEIREIAWATPILISNDTCKEIGDYITVIYPFISEGDRKKIENAILSMPKHGFTKNKEVIHHKMSKLIGCLPSELIESEKAKQFVQKESQKTNGGSLPPNKPLFELLEWEESMPINENDWLREQGISIEEEQNQTIQSLRLPIKEFVETYSSSGISFENVEEIMPTLHKLKSSLDKAEESGVHLRLLEHAWDNLTNACSIIAKQEEIVANQEICEFIKVVIVISSQNTNPVLHPEEEERFEGSISWAIPAPRIQAAIGINNIAKYEKYMDKDIENTIKCLSKDLVPAVRFNLARKLGLLHKNHEVFMWEMVRQFAQNERSYAVLKGLIVSCITPLLYKNPEKATDLLIQIYNRVLEEDKAEDLRNTCVTSFLNLFLNKEEVNSRDVIYKIIETPTLYSSENLHLTYNLRELLVIGSVEEPNEKHTLIRKKSWELLELIVSNSLKEFQYLQSVYKENGEFNELEQEQIRHLAKIADSACKQIYFASNAHDKKKNQEESNPSTAFHKRFLEEASDVLNLLSHFGLPPVTHHLLETLEFLAPLDPCAVFKQIGNVVLLGEEGGYQFESLGVGLIIRLIELYLTEFRSIFIEDSSNHQILLSILDVFVTAGWPEARRITFRLDQLFR